MIAPIMEYSVGQPVDDLAEENLSLPEENAIIRDIDIEPELETDEKFPELPAF